MSKLLKDEVKIVELKKQGLNNSEIAEQIYGNKYMEYKIRRFLKADKGILALKFLEGSENNKKVIIQDDGWRENDVNILTYDIECSPNKSWHWNHRDVFIREENKVQQSFLLTVSYAWNDAPPISHRLTVEEVKNQDDVKLAVIMLEQINRADVIIGFNNKRFDNKIVNMRALLHGLMPPKPVKNIDLFEQAKRLFRFPSNSLDNISGYLGLAGKMQHEGWKLWENCMNYEDVDLCTEYMGKMAMYNEQDIVATRDFYKRIQGWITQGPNIGMMRNEKKRLAGELVDENGVSIKPPTRCRNCGNDSLSLIDTLEYTTAKAYSLYRCDNKPCSHVERYGKAL